MERVNESEKEVNSCICYDYRRPVHIANGSRVDSYSDEVENLFRSAGGQGCRKYVRGHLLGASLNLGEKPFALL